MRKLLMALTMAAAVLCLGPALPAAEPELPRLPFDVSRLTLIDEVDLGQDAPGHRFVAASKEAVARKEILGRRCLVLENGAAAPDRYVAVRLGEGKGLKDCTPYVLQIEYPEDAPRSFIVWNAGNETNLSFHTGATFGDALRMKYVSGNPESVNYPLSGKWQTWTCVFELHQHYPEVNRDAPRSLTPADGFTVALAHYRHENDPLSAGLAVGKVRLFAVDAAALPLQLKLPPEGLPRRHLFWREEMADGILFNKDKTSGFDDARATDWYAAKMRLMHFLGMDTFSKDMLEFGHNQGWDSSKFGSNDWVNQTPFPHMWHALVALAAREKVNVLPMYEYCGSIGGRLAYGVKRRCETLNQSHAGPNGADHYTHIHWSEKANADVTDPDAVEDLRKMLEITIADEAKNAHFLGAWIRPRNSGIPVSFSDRCRALFAKETNAAKTPSRADLKRDRGLYKKYLAWWMTKRRDFLTQIRDYLRRPEVLGKDAVVLYTTDPTEEGRVLQEGHIVADDPQPFAKEKTKPQTPGEVLRKRLFWRALTEPRGTWGKWEWQHSVPENDPENYAQTPGVMLTVPFNRQYTVSDAAALEAFATPDGLAMLRHYPLNEHCFGEDQNRPLGYFVTDFEEAGPYCVLAEARALANGAPRFIGYLAANSFQRGFPEYVRAFNRAFLALPALPSEKVAGAAAAPEVVVRKIATPKDGNWYAVINTGLQTVRDVKVTLPGAPRDWFTGRPAPAAVSLYPGQVLVWHAK